MVIILYGFLLVGEEQMSGGGVILVKKVRVCVRVCVCVCVRVCVRVCVCVCV